MQRGGLDRTFRRWHGRPRRLWLRELRREESQRLRLRHRHRPSRHAQVRHRRHSGLFPERRTLPSPIPMKIVYNWLRDFVDVAAAPQELASRLALSGSNIGGVENGAHGAVIEAEVSSNRPDCLGHYGIAREVSTIYKLPLKHVSPKPAEGKAKASEAVKVEIQSPELCGRFTG